VAAPEYTTPALVLERLRMTDTSIDASYVTLCTAAANALVDVHLEQPADAPLVAPFPELVVRAATGVAMRIYRFRDTETNLDEAWGPEGVAVSLPRDPLAGYVDMLAPYRPGAAWAPA
jgi:hypothetical protein